MDLRTGRTYDTREDALAAGVPESDLALLTPDAHQPDGPPRVTVTKGPFKGRTYQRNDLGQMTRVDGRR
jgi:hypothetical protein